jgi:hypothetical protein
VEALHLLRALLRLLLQRRRHQALDRRGEIVEAIRDVGDERHFGRHHVAHARTVDPHVDELRLAADHGLRAVVLQLVADVDDHVRILRKIQRGDARGGRAADPQGMRLREVRVDLARLRRRHAEQLDELHRLRRRLRRGDLVAGDE